MKGVSLPHLRGLFNFFWHSTYTVFYKHTISKTVQNSPESMNRNLIDASQSLAADAGSFSRWKVCPLVWSLKSFKTNIFSFFSSFFFHKPPPFHQSQIFSWSFSEWSLWRSWLSLSTFHFRVCRDTNGEKSFIFLVNFLKHDHMLKNFKYEEILIKSLLEHWFCKPN